MADLMRDFGDGGWAATCQNAPPPLHVHDTESHAANWHPLPRPDGFRDHPSGAQIVTVPQSRADLLGDDPTDPGACSEPRQATAGMMGKFNVNVGDRNVARGGVRL